ncbi:uncharacterized protein B4U79_05366, partial [Dinothrombium tinctorium]
LLAEAKSIANKKDFSDFIGSNKCVPGFLRRHNLSTRKITHIGQDNRYPLEKKNVVKNYLETTPVYINMTSSTTISFTCEKNIEATHTGNTRTRFTVVLSVSASGKVLKTMVILKGLKKIPNCNIPKNLAIKVSMGGTMNESHMIEWVNSCFKNRGNIFATAKSILFMDEFGSHKKE